MRRLAVALVVVALIAACSDSKKPGGSANSSAGTDKPVVGGTLRVGIERPKTLDPAQISPGSQSELLVADLLFDGLTRMDDKAVTASPAIASSWTAAADQKSWQFTLRGDARFSNGRAITATDVKYSLERVAKLGETSLAALRIDQITGFTPFATGAAGELTGVRSSTTTPSPSTSTRRWRSFRSCCPRPSSGSCRRRRSKRRRRCSHRLR